MTKKKNKLEVPPLGLRPQWIWIERRLAEIEEAILRYADKGKDVPLEWRREFLEHKLFLINRNIK